jgi:hypothetical protein
MNPRKRAEEAKKAKPISSMMLRGLAGPGIKRKVDQEELSNIDSKWRI